MTRSIHPLAGVVALLIILMFWSSTAISEVMLSDSAVTTVKTTIPWGFLILIPALMITGLSGFKLSSRWEGTLVVKKQKRMQFIAANGILVLIPAALYLAAKAQAGAFDSQFYLVQAIELGAGAINIVLLGLNARDGLRLSRRTR